MKRIILTLLIVAMLIGAGSGTILGADSTKSTIGFKADVGIFTSPEFRGSILYGFEVSGTFLGANTSGAVYKSNSSYDKGEKMEAVRLSTFYRKTIIDWLFVDIGGSAWNFFDVDENGDDKTYSGLLAGLSIDIHGIKASVYGHNIVRVKEPDLYALTGGLSYGFDI